MEAIKRHESNRTSTMSHISLRMAGAQKYWQLSYLISLYQRKSLTTHFLFSLLHPFSFTLDCIWK
jgi:hypothetical protein